MFDNTEMHVNTKICGVKVKDVIVGGHPSMKSWTLRPDQIGCDQTVGGKQAKD